MGSGFTNDVMHAENVDFSGGFPVQAQMTTNGDLLIGSTASPNIKVGNLTSPLGTLTIGYSDPDITIDLSGSGQAIDSLTTDVSGPVVPNISGNVAFTGSTNIFSDGSVSNTMRLNLQGTNHALFVGRGSTTASTSLATGSTGQVLQSAGASSDPAFSTATYPSTATGTGTLLRADGTNWVATTSTYPNTNAVNTLLYASSANVMSALATANSGVLTTSSGGVPSIDTTNFQVLSTGVQMKGNNTNTTPPAGFIGESISSTATAVALTSAIAKTITSISLTAGIWDVSAICSTNPSGGTNIAQAFVVGISTTNNTLTGTLGIDYWQLNITGGFGTCTGVVPQLRVILNSTTTYYLVANSVYTSTTSPANGRISATRVG